MMDCIGIIRELGDLKGLDTLSRFFVFYKGYDLLETCNLIFSEK